MQRPRLLQFFRDGLNQTGESPFEQQAVDAQFLNFYPYYIEGKKNHIKVNEDKIYALQKRYEKKLEELHQAKAEVLKKPHALFHPIVSKQFFVVFGYIPFRISEVETGN